MKTIALLTLIFLPGTFIAVGRSTPLVPSQLLSLLNTPNLGSLRYGILQLFTGRR